MKRDIFKEEYEQLMKDIQRYDVLSKEEERDLLKKYQDGDLEAKKTLINCNLRLVASNTTHYSTEYDDLLVLFQEGILGLIRAIEKFDLKHDIKFSTYATPWIRQSMYRYMINNNSQKIPEWMCQLARKVTSYSNHYYSLNGQYPSDELLSSHFGTTISNIIIAKHVLKAPLSISAPIDNDNEDSDLVIEIPDKIDTEKSAINNILRQDLFKLLYETLNEQEKDIIIKRFGLIDNNSLSVAETAKLINLSFNNVAYQEKKALRKIRKSDVKRFEQYL